MSTLWGLLSSRRTTLWILLALAVMLMLNAALPQTSVRGPEAVRALVERNAVWEFLLVGGGLAQLPSSPPFLALLALFFLNLACVMASRAGQIVRGMSRRPPATAELEKRLGQPGTLAAPVVRPLEPGNMIRAMKEFGYRTVLPAPGFAWAVKHRSAPAGSLLFHASFLLIAFGGGWLYYTRFAGQVRLAEGQVFDGKYHTVYRIPPTGDIPAVPFTVKRVEAETRGGDPTDLSVVFAMGAGATGSVRTARINHPASWGPVDLIVSSAGLAPVLWLQDREGFTLDRVTVALPSKRGEPAVVPLASGRLEASVRCEPPGPEFPARERLGELVFEVIVKGPDGTVFDGRLARGRHAPAGDAVLYLPEVRYWADVQVVSERGGGLLVAGFCLAVLGLCWRLLLHRRELVVAWDGGRLRMNGKGEYFGRAFQEEMKAVFDRLLEQEQGSVQNPGGGTD